MAAADVNKEKNLDFILCRTYTFSHSLCFCNKRSAASNTAFTVLYFSTKNSIK